MRFFLIFFLYFFLACSSKNKNIQSSSIKNTQNLEAQFYASLELKQSISELSELKQSKKTSAKAYKDKFFYAWHTKAKIQNAQDIFWSFGAYLNPNKNYYFFNKKPIDKAYFKALIDNGNEKDFLKLKQKALVIENSFLRNIPTQTAILQNPFKDGEGVPFDYSLDGVLNVGSPVLISHYSKDKRYAFVLAESGWGFVEVKNLTHFDDRRAKTYENLNFVTPIKERTSVYDEKGKFAFEARIGAIYPYYAEKKGYFLSKIGDKKVKLSKNYFSPFPLYFNDKNLKTLLAQLLSRPYGWGGYDLERDCSLFIRDIFASFGVHLPRNSRAQSKALKNFDISFLSNKQKQVFITKFAKPYESLLGLKGHIMLYVGKLQDQNAVIHAVWGVRTKDDGRLLIAQTAITSLNIGKHDARVNTEDLLISKIDLISFISLSESQSKQISEYLSQFK
ncbi:SH3 domain-containing C40 family peptidase [Campylobacter sp. MIT 97-5078]|uniref:SH3 domain-containing C40 family peptidase n=1 Tax=Campylobacter sp. MIT 97-5078 TaxID=1548153 RepID=UPI00051390A6|nr:SH3 domain-containing C40 family peptidase [Campylobacter sp. MIT 97-5078]KGI56471.1 hypothetical protein LR59_07115 [Campylobacter sp. MIT 97-5078]TQR28007.1 hypothetical protein DMB91_01890 [Campylobacter sp. MIT 97-5078]